jgi:hypothetical protein
MRRRVSGGDDTGIQAIEFSAYGSTLVYRGQFLLWP